MRPIDTQAPADTRRCIQYWPISSSLLADTGIQTRYEGIVSADLALESELEQLTLTGNNDAMNTVLSIVQDAINSDEVQTIRLKARPTVSALDPLAVSMETDSMVCQLARVHPSVSATARESPTNTILPAENGYTRLVSYIQRSARAEAVQTNPTYADGFALSDNPTSTTSGGTECGQPTSTPPKRTLHCDIKDAKPAAKRQRHGIDSIMYESLAADASPVLEPAPPLSGLTISAGANQTNQNGESGHREAAAGLASSHIELLEDFLVNLFQEEDQLSDVGSAKTDYFHNISHRHSDVALLNKRAVLQLRTLLVACSPEQLTAHVPDDKLGRIIGMLVAVVEAADEINLADMIKSGASVDKDAGLSDSFCSGLDQAMSISSLGLDASGVIVSLAATGKASNSVCPGDVLHAAVSLFKDCLLGCVVPLFDLAPGCELAEVFADNDGFLRSRLLAFLGTVLVAHDPIATLVGGPVLAEQDIISLAFACISVTFCCGDLFGSGDGSNLLESIRRAAQSLLRRVFEAHSDQRMWILEEILASLIKLPTAARLQNTYRIAGGKSVQFITVLLLKLLQCSAQSPEDLTAGFEGRRLPVKEQRMLLQRHKNSIDAAGSSADFVVRYLIGRCVKRDSKASTNETEYRVFLEAFIDNCIVLLGHPQWPAAELVTRVYSLHVLDLLDEEKVDINLKALALESTALIASHIAIAQRENEVQAKNGGTGALEFVLASTLQSSVVRFREMTTALLEYLQSKAVGGESTGAIPLYIGNWASMLISALLQIHKDGRKSRASNGQNRSSENCEDEDECESLDDLADVDVDDNSSIVSDGDGDDAASGNDSVSDSSDSDYENATTSSSRARKRAAATASAQRAAKKLAADKQRAIEECLRDYTNIAHRSTKALVHGVSYASAANAARQVTLLQPLYKSFDILLMRVTIALGASQATLRSKALRTLNQIASHRPAVLYQTSVKFAINHRLQDSSPQVREAAIDLIGKHVVQNPELTSQYYEFISVRVMDKGPSVRRRVMRILKDVYLMSDDQTQLVDIGIRLLQRTNDDERTIRELAFKTLQELWFSHDEVADEDEDELTLASPSGNMFNLLSPDTQRQTLKRVLVMTGVTEAARSRELGELMAGLFEHVTTKTNKVEADGAMFVIRCMVDALFEQLLRSEESEAGTGSGDLLLASENTFSTSACLRFISTLSSIAPDAVGTHSEILGTYLKLTNASDEDTLHSALVILSNTLLSIPHPSVQFLDMLERDLISLLSSSPQSILAIAVPCLCKLVDKVSWSYGKLVRLFRSCVLQLYREQRLIASGEIGAQSPKNMMRFIILAGLMCCHFSFDEHRSRHREHFKELDQLIDDTVPRFMNDLLLFFASSRLPSSVQLAATQMLGQLYIKQPSLALEPQARAVMDRAFSGDSNGHKLQIVRNFLDFLRADVKRYAARAKESKDQVREVDAKALVGNTGEMSEAGVGASLMQTYLDRIIDATFVSSAATLRAVGFEVISLVLEQGLAHPLKCVPALIALSTSSDQHICSKALKLHQDLNFKYASFIHSRDIDGVHKAYEYQVQLRGRAEDAVGYDYCVDTQETAGRQTAFLQPLYSQLRTRRARRNEFLSLLVRAGDADSNSGTLCYNNGGRPDAFFVRFVAENIASLDFKYMDEVLHVMHQISSAIANTGLAILHQLEADTETECASQAVEASVCIGILFVLREFLKAHYGITEAKCAAYNPGDSSSVRDKPATWHTQLDQGRIDWSACPFAVRRMESTADYSDQRARFKHMMAGSLEATEENAGDGRSFDGTGNVSSGSFTDELVLNAEELEQLSEQLLDE